MDIDMDHTKDSPHSACHIERCFLKLSFAVSFGHLPKKHVFLSSLLDRFAGSHEGFIYTNTEYSDMNSEGLIEHDHPSRAHQNLAFSSSSQPFITFQAPENPVYHDLVNRI